MATVPNSTRTTRQAGVRSGRVGVSSEDPGTRLLCQFADPPQVADAEIHFVDGVFAALRLIGLAI